MNIESILNRVPDLRGQSIKESAVLAGGISNLNYLVELEDLRCVVRIGNRHAKLLGVDRNREHECSSIAASLGISPQVISYLPDLDVLVVEHIEGKVLEPEDATKNDLMHRIIESLLILHNGPRLPGTFSVFDTSRRYFDLASERCGDLKERLTGMGQRLSGLQDEYGRFEPDVCPCHNDLWTLNMILANGKVYLIDWEYAAMGDRYFDLGYLAASSDFSSEQCEMLLSMYFENIDDCHRMRLRMMKQAAHILAYAWGYLMSTLEFSSETKAASGESGFDYAAYAEEHKARLATE